MNNTLTLREKRQKAARESAKVRKANGAKKNLDRDKTLEAIRQQIFKVAGTLVRAQVVEAVGYYQMMTIKRVAGVVKYVRVTDKDEFDELIETGEAGKDYIIMARQDPNHKASDAVLNRAYGRPTESIEMSNKDGLPFVIIIDK